MPESELLQNAMEILSRLQPHLLPDSVAVILDVQLRQAEHGGPTEGV